MTVGFCEELQRLGRRMRQGLGLLSREPEAPWVGTKQRHDALLGHHEQLVGVGQQEQLAVTVAASLPLPLTSLQVDAGEDVRIEAV